MVSGDFIIDSKQIPVKYYADHKLISHYGKIEIKPTEDKQNFSVGFFDIPQTECIKFSNEMMTKNYEFVYNRYSIKVNNEVVNNSKPSCGEKKHHVDFNGIEISISFVS